MSAFDATINVGGIDFQVQEDEQGRKIEGQMILGVMAAIPTGPNQIAPLPLGALRVRLDKRAAGIVAKAAAELEEELEARPNIQVASSLEGVDQAAQQSAALRA